MDELKECIEGQVSVLLLLVASEVLAFTKCDVNGLLHAVHFIAKWVLLALTAKNQYQDEKEKKEKEEEKKAEEHKEKSVAATRRSYSLFSSSDDDQTSLDPMNK